MNAKLLTLVCAAMVAPTAAIYCRSFYNDSGTWRNTTIQCNSGVQYCRSKTTRVVDLETNQVSYSPIAECDNDGYCGTGNVNSFGVMNNSCMSLWQSSTSSTTLYCSKSNITNGTIPSGASCPSMTCTQGSGQCPGIWSSSNWTCSPQPSPPPPPPKYCAPAVSIYNSSTCSSTPANGLLFSGTVVSENIASTLNTFTVNTSVGSGYFSATCDQFQFYWNSGNAYPDAFQRITSGNSCFRIGSTNLYAKVDCSSNSGLSQDSYTALFNNGLANSAGTQLYASGTCASTSLNNWGSAKANSFKATCHNEGHTLTSDGSSIQSVQANATVQVYNGTTCSGTTFATLRGVSGNSGTGQWSYIQFPQCSKQNGQSCQTLNYVTETMTLTGVTAAQFSSAQGDFAYALTQTMSNAYNSTSPCTTSTGASCPSNAARPYCYNRGSSCFCGTTCSPMPCSSTDVMLDVPSAVPTPSPPTPTPTPTPSPTNSSGGRRFEASFVVTRRTTSSISVTYNLVAANASLASSAATFLNNYTRSSAFLANLKSQNGAAFGSLTNITITSSASAASQGNASSSSGLSVGAIVGIVIGCIFAVVFVILFVYYLCCKGKGDNRMQPTAQPEVGGGTTQA